MARPAVAECDARYWVKFTELSTIVICMVSVAFRALMNPVLAGLPPSLFWT